jgi:predicted transcriptional regulator
MAQLNISVSEKVLAKIDEMAKAKGYTRSTYATILFDAAYAARVDIAADVELTAMIGMIMILYKSKKEINEIAKAIGFKPETIDRILEAWRAELGRRSGR